MMGDVFLSIRGRAILNVEALNMTESVGNYVKHRRVPVILPGEGGFITYFAPAISGESIAHGFQEVLAEEAIKKGLPVCNLCKSGIFLKSTNKNVLEEAFKGKNVDYKELEKFIVKNCIVEDVGGFLYAEEENIKRTSNFYTGYMIPAKEALSNSVIESQLHSRYALGTPFVKKGEGQMIYYVELSSACYTFSFDFDSKYVGKLTFSYEHSGEVALNSNEERKNRIELTLDALKRFLVENLFGAKKTRFMPVSGWESIAIAVSDDVWTVPSPFVSKYIENSAKKLKSISHNTKIYTYVEESKTVPEDVKKSINLLGSFEETVDSAINDAKDRLKK
jgi:CRISPR-associated protein Csa2